MIRKLIGICSLAVLLAMGSASVAKADGVVDTFTYTSNGNTFVWQLPASPVPDGGDVYAGFGFILNDVLVSENGGTAQLGSFGFYSVLCAGGFDLLAGDIFLSSAWSQLYTGPESSPTFLTGIFQLNEFGSTTNLLLANEAGAPSTLEISNTTVPEPATFSLLLIGSLGLLVAARRKAC
jgi:hypothetical protein